MSSVNNKIQRDDCVFFFCFEFIMASKMLVTPVAWTFL